MYLYLGIMAQASKDLQRDERVYSTRNNYITALKKSFVATDVDAPPLSKRIRNFKGTEKKYVGNWKRRAARRQQQQELQQQQQQEQQPEASIVNEEEPRIQSTPPTTPISGDLGSDTTRADELRVTTS